MPNTNYAFFNYALSYNDISGFLAAAANSKDRLRIFVSPDAAGGGHLITHNIDFGRTYDGARGLVPALTSGLSASKSFLRGDGWAGFWSLTAQDAEAGNGSTAQQQANIDTYLQNTLVSAYDIKQWINQSFSANDAMRFKGTITVDTDNVISTTTAGGINVSGFPTTCEVGDTYKVAGTQNKTLAGQNVNTGDMLVCIKDGTGNSLNDAQYWTIVQSNVEHLTRYSINGTAHDIYTQTSGGATIFAPTTAGTTGQVLVSAGGTSAPTWANQNTLVVAQAGKVTNALTKGTGLAFTKSGNTAANSYDGSEAITISLLKATTSTLGGVIIDNGNNSAMHTATGNSAPTITMDSDGQIYLTQQNIINALGFTPGNSTGQVAGMVVASSASGTSNTSSATANPYINIIDSSHVIGHVHISGTGNVSVKSVASDAAITVSLGAATSDNYGGIKIGYTTSSANKNYAVQLSDGKAYVNVPWVSDVFSPTANGLAPMASTENKQTSGSDNIASATTFLLGADGKWHKLPSSAFQGARRIVSLSGTTIIAADSGNALNVVAGQHVTITAEQTTGANPAYTGKLTFNAVWRDIQIRKVVGSSIGATPASVNQNTPIVFENSESVFMLGEDDTTNNKTTIKAYMTWYNLEDGSYELV